MIRTKMFQHGRFNYSIDYRQFKMPVVDTETGETTQELVHQETVHYYEFPFHFGTQTQFGLCTDTDEYFKQ